MPAVDTVLLPLCVGLTLLGVIATGIAWRRGNKGRVVQGVGLALAPIALYFSGLLSLLWNAAVAVGRWASAIILSPAVWFGLTLLGVCVVLWVVGGFVARRYPRREAKTASARTGVERQPNATTPALSPTSPARKTSPAAAKQPTVDDDMAEIEALLKARGIE